MPRQKPTPLGGLTPRYGAPRNKGRGPGARPNARGLKTANARPGANNARLYPLTAKKQRKQRPGLIRGIVAAAVLVVFMGVWNPPTGSVHSFTKASDYNAAKESGCTNSGGGCHGSESDYTDFNKYHPEAECTTCHDYQGVGCIPCHAPAEHECALCHDGSMDKALDAVRLTDSYPKGHYRQTKHGAMGTDMAQVVKTTSDGKASATCEQCHSVDLREAHTGVPVVDGSTYGTDIGCGECHNDVRTGAQAAVKAKWKARTCEACHAVGTASAMHDAKIAGETKATDSRGCAESGTGCHNTVDLHAMHPDAPKNCSGSASEGEPGCHELDVEAPKPQTASCGSETASDTCHAQYTPAQLSHDRDTEVHSPSTSVAADDTSFYDTPCGGCHLMEPNGTSLMDEHALPTAEKRLVPEDTCRDCHNDTASAATIANDWKAKDSAEACGSCHGTEGLDPVHSGSVSAKHTVAGGSQGCASTGPGCHPTADISDAATATVTGGLHASCLRCHDPRKTNGNLSYDPTQKTCGTGEDCHATGYDPAAPVHISKSGRTGGTDSKHIAGASQRGDMYWDDASGVGVSCGVCHDMALGTEHARPNSPMPAGKSGCLTCHNRNLGTARVVKASWSAKNTAQACGACHDGISAPQAHDAVASVHGATELNASGAAVPGTCVKSGCHGSADVRSIHRRAGCTIDGCHTSEGDIRGHRVMSCGGTDAAISCHTGFAGKHYDLDTGKPVSHSADLTGTVGGIEYAAGANVGCFGCHSTSLVGEHKRELEAGALDGGGSGYCVVCHGDTGDPAANAYALSTAVMHAIETGDHRCVACHRSGSALDGPDAVASPHKQVSTADTLPPGAVWADPFDEWKVAFETTTGGGHNALSAGVVGSSAAAKAFPLESFKIGAGAYTWTLPANSGTTTWLKASVFGTSTVATSESISHITITCQDCHTIPADMVGPHGASAHVGIDPAFSQTEYANPSATGNQFSATGTDRVVCMKCHDMESAVTASGRPGGSPVHSAHRLKTLFSASDQRRQANRKCIDCHVRIPHAWKRPRLLVRTVVDSDGVQPDAYPYVRRDHNGLVGVQLGNYAGSSGPDKRDCTTGGCHAMSSSSSHPATGTVPSRVYWP